MSLNVFCAAVVPVIMRNADSLTESSAEVLYSLFERFDYSPGI